MQCRSFSSNAFVSVLTALLAVLVLAAALAVVVAAAVAAVAAVTVAAVAALAGADLCFFGSRSLRSPLWPWPFALFDADAEAGAADALVEAVAEAEP